MLGPANYALWCLGFVAEAGVVVCSLRGRVFLNYLALNLFMIGTFGISAGRLLIFLRFGFGSQQYLYFYYYSEALGIILLYFSIINLFHRLLQDWRPRELVRGVAISVLLITVLVSYLVVRHSENHLTDRFVVELTQNLYFVGLVMAYVLWGAMVKLREVRMRIILFVLSLGIFFSAHAATYAFRSFFPSWALWKLIPPLLGLWLPLSWLYTLGIVREDSLLVPAGSILPAVARHPWRVGGAGGSPEDD